MADEDRAALLAEADKRGLLPPDMKTAYDEAQKRGIVKPETSAIGNFFKSIPGGIVEGFSAAASAGGQAAAHEMSQPDVAAEIPTPPQTADILQQNVTGELPKPQGAAGRFGRTLGEFAGSPATWVAPGSMVLKAGGMAASALGSEAAGQLTEGTGLEPWARVLGAIVGGVGATKTAGAVKNIVNPGTQASADLRRAILRDGDTPEGLSAKLAEMQKIRPDATLADVGGENVRGLVERVAQTPGAGRTIVQPALTERQQAQRARIADDLADLPVPGPEFGPVVIKRTAMEALDETMNARKVAADPLYDQARNFNARDNPEIMQAWERETSGGFGKKILNSSEFKDTLQTEYGIADATQAPMMVVIDTWKKVADDMVKSAVKGGNNNTARVIGNMRDKVLEVVDTANPAYPKAREAWGGPSRYMDAIADGKDILSPKVTAEELAAKWSSMTDADREAYRIGAVSAIKGKMGNDPAKMADMTKYLRSPEMRGKIATMMPTPEAAASWEQRLGYEVKSSELTGQALGNSATARRLAERADADGIVGDLVMDALSHGLHGTLWRLLTAGPKRVRDTVRSRSDKVLGSVLTEPQAPALESTLEGAAQTAQPSGSAAAARALAVSSPLQITIPVPLAGSGP